MVGTKAGTGQPVRCRCSQCRFTHLLTVDEINDPRPRGFNLKLLKRAPIYRHQMGKPGQRMSRKWRYQYECMDCGHVGWTRHVELEHKWNREHIGEDQAQR